MFKNVLLAILCLCFPAGAAETLWTYDAAAGYFDCSPGVGDLNGDGLPDFVLVTTTGSVVALGGDRSDLWRYETNEPLSIAPTVANVTGGPELEAIILANSGRVLCFEGASGTVLWQVSLGGLVNWGTSGVVASDLDGNGSLELIVADSLETLTCLNGEGNVLWTHKHAGGFNSYPAVGDINGDGKPELLVGATDSPVVCLSSEGKELWRMPAAGAEGSSPSLFDLTGDGRPEILVGLGNGIAAVDSAGAVLWTYPMTKDVDCAVTVADADADGTVEIYVADLVGQFVSLTADGGLRWEANLGQRVRRNASVADVDGDGVNEVLVAGYSNRLYVFDPKGLLEETVDVNGQVNATPTVADFNGDGFLEVAVPASGGKLYLFGWTQGGEKGAILAGQFRMNSARTATVTPVEKTEAVAVETLDCGDYYVGSNIFAVAVTNPEKKPLEVSMTVSRDGVASSAAKMSSEEGCIVNDLIYTLDGSAPVALKFECQVSENGQVLAQRSNSVYIMPFARELADLGRLADQIGEQLPKLAEAKVPENVMYRVQAQLPALKERCAVAGSSSAAERTRLASELADLRRDAARAAAMVQTAASAQASLAVYSTNPWAPFGKTDELVERVKAGTLKEVAKEAVVNVAAFGGEKESAAVNVFNFCDRPRILRVDVAGLKNADATQPCVEVREVLDVPTQMRVYSGDALPSLNEGRTIVVPAWDTRQLWITVDTDKLAAGTWAGDIRLRALDVEPAEAVAKLSVEVWNARLPEKQALSLCHWGYVHTSILKDQPQAALDDQVSHNTNVFVGTLFPQAKCDDSGNLVGPIDFAAHDEYVRQHAPHGKILFCGYQGALSGAPPASEGWKKAHVEYLRAWVKHLAEIGVAYEGFALYPVDEPGLSPGLVEAYIELAKLARQADPKIRMYTDPVAACTLAEMQAMAPYVDIWCPNRGGFLIKQNADKLAFIKSTGAEVWTYECEANAKHQSPLGYYRSQAWLAWDHGLTGIGFWSYCTSVDDPWYFADKEYLLIYHGSGVVPSKRWEAIRDGVEDYGMLAELRQVADAAEKDGRAPDLVAQARILLTVEAKRIADYCGRDRYGTEPGARGQTGDRKLAEARWENIQSVRRAIADLKDKL